MLKDKLIELVVSISEEHGTDFKGAFRDILTEMYHIADDVGLDIDEQYTAAGEVYTEEIRAEE